ncbi:hypothetical protein Glove_140g88 [Diversispora epigaea]|uniref:Uncharacterized protein n=1 Tax=Diversispora epigaea TaxID=1348612 RepID=A0A397IZM5_9GLOM|nr:hypothetical protein Glove_140g88 [Diversispora epigaea]
MKLTSKFNKSNSQNSEEGKRDERNEGGGRERLMAKKYGYFNLIHQSYNEAVIN